jgi:primase-polymerase (primpol)-like protein
VDIRCEQCGTELPLLARKHARYCSARCRTAACRNRAAIPRALTRRNRWVRWSAGKVPLQADGRTASSTDPGTWTGYAAAKAATAGVGMGFVLNGDGIACIDLDHCISDGQLAQWAAEILALLPPTYAEVSPSGTGLHVWCYGTVGKGRKVRRADGACIELYDCGRYMTVTGNRWKDSPAQLADLGHIASLF